MSKLAHQVISEFLDCVLSSRGEEKQEVFLHSGRRACDALQLVPALIASHLAGKEMEIVAALLPRTEAQDEDTAVVALALLQTLTFGNWEFKSAVLWSGLPHLLVVLSSPRSDLVLKRAMDVLTNVLAGTLDGQASFAEMGGLEVLASLCAKASSFEDDVALSLLALAGNAVNQNGACRSFLSSNSGLHSLVLLPVKWEGDISEEFITRYLQCLPAVLPGCVAETKVFTHEVVPFVRELSIFTPVLENMMVAVQEAAPMEIHCTFSSSLGSGSQLTFSGPNNYSCHCSINGPKLAVSKESSGDGILRWRFRFEIGHNSCFLVGIVESSACTNERCQDVAGAVAMKNNGTSSSVEHRIDIPSGGMAEVIADMSQRKCTFFVEDREVHKTDIPSSMKEVRLAFTFWNNGKVTLVPRT